tara:strand:- start:9482 stop:10237 length:756 start_codon:yes stop_codon:yes gene_type:complete
VSSLDHHFFLITSTGRTGTTLFSEILNASGEAQVVHEPIRSEQYFHRLALEYPEFSRNYINRFRLKEIFLRKDNNKKKYGEVNGALRRCVKDLKVSLPNVPVIHIVRDGRDLVSSILNRHTFTESDSIYGSMVPHESIIPSNVWLNMTRFEKICFIWSEENRWLSEVCDVTVQFEKLIHDYDYFQYNIGDRVGLKVDRETWAFHTKKKINQNEGYRTENKPERWTEEQNLMFERICGDQMEKYGYWKKSHS